MLKLAILGITLVGSAIAEPQNGVRTLADASDLPQDKAKQVAKDIVGQFQVVGTLCYDENMDGTDEVVISKLKMQFALPNQRIRVAAFVVQVTTFVVTAFWPYHLPLVALVIGFIVPTWVGEVDGGYSLETSHPPLQP